MSQLFHSGRRWRLNHVTIVVALIMLITGCSLEQVRPRPVTTMKPAEGTVLSKSEPVHAYSLIVVEYPIGEVVVSLWDVTTNTEQTWTFPNPTQSTTFLLDQQLHIDPALPVGNDYRFQVTAYPAGNQSGAFGYSTPVEVTP